MLLKIPGDLKKPTTVYCPVWVLFFSYIVLLSRMQMAPSLFESGALQIADWSLTPFFKHLSLDNVSLR